MDMVLFHAPEVLHSAAFLVIGLVEVNAVRKVVLSLAAAKG